MLILFNVLASPCSRVTKPWKPPQRSCKGPTCLPSASGDGKLNEGGSAAVPWVLVLERRAIREDMPSTWGLVLNLSCAHHGHAWHSRESVGNKIDKDSTIITDVVLLHDARLV